MSRTYQLILTYFECRKQTGYGVSYCWVLVVFGTWRAPWRGWTWASSIQYRFRTWNHCGGSFILHPSSLSLFWFPSASPFFLFYGVPINLVSWGLPTYRLIDLSRGVSQRMTYRLIPPPSCKSMLCCLNGHKMSIGSTLRRSPRNPRLEAYQRKKDIIRIIRRSQDLTTVR